MTPGEQAFEDFEADWEAEVNARVEQMETLALVMLVQKGVEDAERRLRVAEYELAEAAKAASSARERLVRLTNTLDEATRLAARLT